MDRKQFLRTSLSLGALCGLRPAGAEQTKTPPAAAPTPQQACETKARFGQAWAKSLVECLDAELPEKERTAVMKARGRACARQGATRQAEKHRGDLDGFIAEIVAHAGPDAARREANTVHVKYPRCYCPLVADLSEALSPTYCQCSVGWLEQMYETVSGKPVTVEVLETVKRGGTCCRFTVRLQA